jgi:hypothetical protein
LNCVIFQPSYIPWRGFFHQVAKADLFIFYDDVQFDKHGWRNRNRIKTHQGSRWLTIPVHDRHAPVEHTLINQVEIDWRQPWNRKHWSTIQQEYGKAPYLKNYAPMLEYFYTLQTGLLADFDVEFTIALARELGITHTRFIRSSSLAQTGEKTDRLLSMLVPLGVSHYITGPSARSYLEEDKFAQAGISLEYMVYDYRAYEQLYPPYDPQVSIIDLLLMKGPEALSYIIE